VRVLRQPAARIGDADLAQHVERTVERRAPPEPFVEPQRLGELLAHGKDRVERGHGLLEHHRDQATAQATQLGLGKGQDVEGPAAGWGEADGAPFDPAALALDQAHDRQGGDRLAGARLADDRQRLARGDSEGDTVDGGRTPRATAEGDLEPLDLEKGGAQAGGSTVPVRRSRSSGSSSKRGKGVTQRRVVVAGSRRSSNGS